jgi:hypothetical protein
MTRRKNTVPRYPNGQPRRAAQLTPPTEAHRLRDAALAGMRDSVWGTSLGRLFLAGQITATQFSAGKRWAELSAKYSVACGGPAPARSAKLDPDGGTTADPDSPQGRKEARRHGLTVERYLAASRVLKGMGKAAESAVRDVCDRDLHPVGMIHLRGGLSALAALWGSTS